MKNHKKISKQKSIHGLLFRQTILRCRANQALTFTLQNSALFFSLKSSFPDNSTNIKNRTKTKAKSKTTPGNKKQPKKNRQANKNSHTRLKEHDFSLNLWKTTCDNSDPRNFCFNSVLGNHRSESNNYNSGRSIFDFRISDAKHPVLYNSENFSEISQKRRNDSRKVEEDGQLQGEALMAWNNLMKCFKPSLRNLLEEDLMRKEFIDLRKQVSRRHHLVKAEIELIDGYKKEYGFSCILLLAISIILERPYALIKKKWLKERTFNRCSTVSSVDTAIRKKLKMLISYQYNKQKDNIDISILDSEKITRELQFLNRKCQEGFLPEFQRIQEMFRTTEGFVAHGSVISYSKSSGSVAKRDRSVPDENEDGKRKRRKIKDGEPLLSISDVSQGTSPYPLRCINDVDDEKFPNIRFISECFDSKDLPNLDDALAFTPGCACSSGCTNKDGSCICSKEMYQGRFPYDENGCLVDWPVGYPIYECNSNCSCSSDCRNRVVQKGPTMELEIFKTPFKGWGVRTRVDISKGKFVCEYIGEIITTEEADRRGLQYDSIHCSYLFDLDVEGRNCFFTIDASNNGNVSRFINHCCEPNLQNYQVWIDNLDKRKPRVALFANRDIKKGEELSFDYKYETIKSKGKKRNPHSIPCKCGAKNCRGVLF